MSDLGNRFKQMRTHACQLNASKGVLRRANSDINPHEYGASAAPVASATPSVLTMRDGSYLEKRGKNIVSNELMLRMTKGQRFQCNCSVVDEVVEVCSGTIPESSVGRSRDLQQESHRQCHL